MRTFLFLFALTLLPALPVAAQYSYPSSASRRLYFAQLADGGPAAQKWTTTIALANPDTATLAEVRFTFYGDNGQQLPLDFGQGSSSTLTVFVPAGGSKILTSTGAPGQPVVGWGRAVSSIPIYGTVIYRATANGVPVWDVAAAGTNSTLAFSSQAAYTTGVALANPSGYDTIHLRVSNRDQNGIAGRDYDVTLPPVSHTSFTLGGVVAGLPRSFTGTVSITSTDSLPSAFVAWTLYERDGLLSPLPPGEIRAVGQTSRRALDALGFMQAGAVTLVRSMGPELYNTPPETIVQYVRQKGVVLEESGTLKATYETLDDSVHVSRAMVETMGASDAALAFLVGHLMARGILQRTGLPDEGMFAGTTIATASDVGSLASMLAVGYDPGGIADFYSRLYTASAQGLPMDPFLLTEFGPLSQITVRQTQIWSYLLRGCAATSELTQICKKAHDYWHPTYPANVP